MLVDNEQALEALFSQAHLPIATHCEDEETIKTNLEYYKNEYGEAIPFSCHPKIRSVDACYISSSKAVDWLKRFGPGCIYFISPPEKKPLFLKKKLYLKDKLITAEACIHHLWFTDQDYQSKGSAIKWNPAIKAPRSERLCGSPSGWTIDVIATDHAPHTMEEKNNAIFRPSGGPLSTQPCGHDRILSSRQDSA